MKGWLQKNWPITLILLIAAALRFYRFWELPYTHDELSALLRAQVHSWSEFIETGVKLDNHPAGVQLLIFLQTLVSYEEWWIKLPYLVLGVWSVWLIYINGRILNLSESGSLFAASLLAVSQYTISYSQWARPYSVGLFLVLLLTWVLLKFRDDESKSFRWLMWYSIVAALTGYVHYFTLLQAIIVSVFFLPFLNKRQRIQLALAGVFSALMWLPHIGITLHQMGRGGIGEWLHVPESGLWLNLIQYTFHFSMVVLVCLALIIALGILLKNKQLINKTSLFLLLTSVSAYIIGYGYSVNVNPLLHQGVTLFSVPFIFLLIGQFLDDQRKFLLVLPFVTVIIMIYSLICSRDHYQINYMAEHHTPLRWLSELQNADASLPALIDLREDFVNLEFDKGIAERSEVQFVFPLWQDAELQAYLDQLDSPRLFFACASTSAPEVFASVLDHFPCIAEAKYYQGGEAYVLSKECDSRTSVAKEEIFDELINRDNPFSSSHKWKWGELDPLTNTHIVLEYQGLSRDALIVIDVERPGGNLWSGVDLAKFKNPRMIRRKSYQALLNSEIENRDDANVSTYVWVNGNGGLELLEFYAYSVPANPHKFRLFRE